MSEPTTKAGLELAAQLHQCYSPIEYDSWKAWIMAIETEARTGYVPLDADMAEWVDERIAEARADLAARIEKRMTELDKGQERVDRETGYDNWDFSRAISATLRIVREEAER